MAKDKTPSKNERAMDTLAQGGVVDLLELELPEEEGQSFRLQRDGAPVEMSLQELLALAQECLDGKQKPEQRTALEREADLSGVPELREFVEAHPDINELPREVVDGLRDGRGLMRAYADYENAQLKDKLRAYEQNEKNRVTAPGSVRGDAADDAQLDELLKVFNAVFY